MPRQVPYGYVAGLETGYKINMLRREMAMRQQQMQMQAERQRLDQEWREGQVARQAQIAQLRAKLMKESEKETREYEDKKLRQERKMATVSQLGTELATGYEVPSHFDFSSLATPQGYPNPEALVEALGEFPKREEPVDAKTQMAIKKMEAEIGKINAQREKLAAEAANEMLGGETKSKGFGDMKNSELTTILKTVQSEGVQEGDLMFEVGQLAESELRSRLLRGKSPGQQLVQDKSLGFNFDKAQQLAGLRQWIRSLGQPAPSGMEAFQTPTVSEHDDVPVPLAGKIVEEAKQVKLKKHEVKAVDGAVIGQGESDQQYQLRLKNRDKAIDKLYKEVVSNGMTLGEFLTELDRIQLEFSVKGAKTGGK
jgi:hypothetical protein